MTSVIPLLDRLLTTHRSGPFGRLQPGYGQTGQDAEHRAGRSSGSIPAVSGTRLRRIGVLGGTFDPPHNGHLLAAVEARERLDLDLVLLTVANDPWQKTGAVGDGTEGTVSSAEVRLAMVVAAVDGVDGLVADDVEIQRGGPTYTADTLVTLGERYPGSDLVLLLGSDVAPGLDTWVRPEEVRRRATIVVMDRPGHDGGRPPAHWEYEVLEVPLLEMAGIELRNRAADGLSVRDHVPDAVADLIESHDLYRRSR